MAQIRLNHSSLTHNSRGIKGTSDLERFLKRFLEGPNDRAYIQTRTHAYTKAQTRCPVDNPDKTGKREKVRTVEFDSVFMRSV